MDSAILDDRFSLTDMEMARLDYFKDYLWYNSEVCNNCLTRVRDIGPEIARSAEGQTFYINEWYERTEWGSQEFAPGDDNRRHGQCYCLDCGRDLSADHRNTDLESLLEIAVNCYGYIYHHTPLDVNKTRFTNEIVRLKKDPDKTGYETEILAVAFARSVEHTPRSEGESGSSRAAISD